MTKSILVKKEGSWTNASAFELIESVGEDMSKEKEEFKVDKLGWYDSEHNIKFKALHELKNGYVLVDEDNYISFECDKDGNITGYDNKLTKYLGPELPKEPRKLEFESCYSEYDGFTDIEYEIEKELIEGKWHIVMTEVIE